MARPLRIEFPGAIYHVASRGDRREPIFVDDVDRTALLEVLGSGLDRFDASALAWCLMGNHYHCVIQTRLANLSLLMDIQGQIPINPSASARRFCLAQRPATPSNRPATRTTPTAR